MGIDARVETENGEIEAELLDPNNLVARLISPFNESAFSCVRFIDPYGDTTFNQLQLPVVVEELRSAIELSQEPDVQAHGETLLDMARKATGEVHTYLKFYGD